MREVDVKLIENALSRLCIEANMQVPYDVKEKITYAIKEEENPTAKEVLSDIKENSECAKRLNLPVCQDTGMAVVFLEIGQECYLIGGDIYDAVNRGVRNGYIKGYLRKSVVKDPLNRVNTEDNTPAVIHTEIIPGSKIKITVAPKGFGSENMSKIKMMLPSSNKQDIIDAIVDVVKQAASNACPPMIVGVGIGGDFEKCALLSKKALTIDLTEDNPDPFYNEMEKETLKRINELNIGPQGFGGKTTALAVKILTYPTHIAGLPLAVNIGCHVTRHKTAEI